MAKPRTLFTKTALTFSLLIGVSLLLSGLVGIGYSYRENRLALVRLQHEKAAAAAGRIGQHLFDLEQRIAATAEPGPGVPALAQRSLEIRLLRRNPAVHEIALLDSKGVEYLRVSRRAADVERSGRDLSDAEPFRLVRSGRPYRSPIYFRDGALYMTLAMAVGPEEAGITVAEIDLEFLLAGIMGITMGEAGHAYAVDAEGRLIAHLDIGLVLRNTSLAALPQVQAAIKGEVHGDGDGSHTHGVDGEAVLTAFAAIPQLGWFVFVEEPLAEAYRPLVAQAARSALIAVIGMLVTLLACVALVRRMVRPIHALEEGAARIGGGALDHRIVVRTGDELEELAGRFNRMAEQLQESYATLERKVAERTSELSLSLEQSRSQQAALQESEARLRTIIEAEPECIKIVDARGCLKEMNPAGLAMIEAGSLEEVRGRLVQELVAPAYRAAYAEMHRRVLAGESRTLEYEIVGQKGGRRWMETHAVPIDDKGEVLQLAVTRDITPRKLAEDARARLETQLRESQKMEALGTLAGGIAHDFNNALAAILGNAELARRDVGPGHAALESLDEIGKASRRAKDLVQQILAFGRRQNLERTVMSLEPVVAESARLLRATLPAQVSLRVDCLGATPVVLANPTQVNQILLNLCGNALQAVQNQERPAKIEVRLEAFTRAEAHGALPPGRYACLTVRDNGCGMDEATRSRIFEPFFTTKPVGQGTGLGLSVVHGIVRAHDASIEVHSAPGEGSEFRICFPAVDAPVPDVALAAAAAAAPVGGRGKRVLCVDDEEAIVFLMTRLLERHGYRVSGYTDPRQALAALKDDPAQFDLAVTDYSMPGMSGLELATAIREIRADLPIVLASGYITEELRAAAPAAGVCELIYKPSAVEDLCEVVARVAGGGSEPESAS